MTKPLYDRSRVLGVLLAGGRSRRMGGEDKSSLSCGGFTLLDQVIDRAAPQVQQLIVSSNTLTTDYYRGHAVVADSVSGFPGPLAGIVAAMQWCQHTRQHNPQQSNQQDYQWLATFATDTPFVPTDFVQLCLERAVGTGADVVYASFGGKHHYAMSLWRTQLRRYLAQRLSEGERALRVLLNECGAQPKAFEAVPFAPGGDPFFNINTPADWHLAQRFLVPEHSKD